MPTLLIFESNHLRRPDLTVVKDSNDVGSRGKPTQVLDRPGPPPPHIFGRYMVTALRNSLSYTRYTKFSIEEREKSKAN